jgi:hypothetical protein
MNNVKDFGDYSVKNVKSFMGMEGYGFNCSLYRNGKKVGFCIDDASGGDMHPIQWDRNIDWKEEQRLLNAHVKSLPKVKSSFGNGKEMELTIDEGWFVTELVNKWELDRDIRKMKKQCSAKTLFRHSNCKRGSYMILGSPYSDEVKARLIREHGKDVEIFNEVLERGELPSVFKPLPSPTEV